MTNEETDGIIQKLQAENDAAQETLKGAEAAEDTIGRNEALMQALGAYKTVPEEPAADVEVE